MRFKIFSPIVAVSQIFCELRSLQEIPELLYERPSMRQLQLARLLSSSSLAHRAGSGSGSGSKALVLGWKACV